MYCPKCGMENPDDVQICSTCGYVLKSDVADKPVAKPKTSRLAIASFVLSFLTVFVYIFAGIPAIILSIISIFRISRSGTKLKGKTFAIAGLLISLLLMLLIFLWNIDAPSIPDDYTIADLRSAPTECNRSYELLMSLSEEQECPLDAPKIGLSAQDVNTIGQVNEVIKKGDYSKITETLEANADSINQAWENAKKGRNIISELNTFPEVADLTEPDLDAEMKSLRNFRHLTRLYQSYIYLQTEQGNGQSALNELIELDSVFGKLSVNARTTITKLVCIACLANNIIAANFIANNPQTSQESLELLAEHFIPLTNEQISLRNSVISEYLMFKKALEKDFDQAKWKNSPMLKRNSASRLYKNSCDRWIAVEENRQRIEELTVWPSIYPDWLPVSVDSEGQVPWFYKCYNPVGSLLIQILTPVMDRVSEIKTKLQVHDDLLQIVLNKRLGKEVSLKARAYSDEYIIDVENKKIFSSGPDGKADTKDDIKLPINLDVLHWPD